MPLQSGTSPPLIQRATVAYDAARAAGLSPTQAAALLGHAQTESGIGAHTNPGEGAVGLIHWRQGRRTALEALARQRGESGFGSIPTQVEYFMQEAEGKGARLTAAQQAAYRWFKNNPNAPVEQLATVLKGAISYGTNTTGERVANAQRWQAIMANRNQPTVASPSIVPQPGLAAQAGINDIALPRELLSSDSLSRSGKMVGGGTLSATDGAMLGSQMGRAFTREVGSVPVEVGVSNSSSGVAPFSTPPPTGGDTPTE